MAIVLFLALSISVIFEDFLWILFWKVIVRIRSDMFDSQMSTASVDCWDHVVSDFSNTKRQLTFFSEFCYLWKIIIQDSIYTSGKILHCVKSVRIRSFSGPHFATFGLNTAPEKLRIRTLFTQYCYFMVLTIFSQTFTNNSNN